MGDLVFSFFSPTTCFKLSYNILAYSLGLTYYLFLWLDQWLLLPTVVTDNCPASPLRAGFVLCALIQGNVYAQISEQISFKVITFST